MQNIEPCPNCKLWKECATKLLEALVSYKRYTPFPYKQNPVYIIGANEAEQMFNELSMKELHGKL